MGGPDAQRYWHLAGGGEVPRPFHLRWLLPAICGQDERRWWIVHVGGWLLATVGMFGWVVASHDWRVAAAATALLLGLPGILGPSAVIPVGVDIQATGLTLCAAALFVHDQTLFALVVALLAAMVRESSPVWLALWVWSPILLVALAAPIVASVVRRPGPDPTGSKGQWIADHPVRAGLMFHRGRWRDGWLLVAPWGLTLAALISPSWPLIVVLVVAHLQLLVATDTVRIVAHAAGPVMAVAAATVFPVEWLLLVCVLHIWWFRQPERV
jgi:hypothetical protein